jgi:hypothetical protein
MSLANDGHRNSAGKFVHSFHGMNLLDIYDSYLSPHKENPITILEIGIDTGGSLLMWRDYFPNAQIIGIDINPNIRKDFDPRVNIEIGSQIDPVFLQSVCNKYGPFDVIIDDGSHINEYTLASYKFLWNHLKSNGFYIIEDTHCTWIDLEARIRTLWPGMSHNKEDMPSDNRQTRYLINESILESLRRMDNNEGDIRFMHFWSKCCIIKKI